MDPVTEKVRLALALAMLAGASWSDLRSRRVRNQYWLPFAAFAAVLALGDLLREDPRDLLPPYAVAAALCGLFYAIWRLRLFGGADAKGLMVLSFLMPWPREPTVPLPAALDALANASLVMLAVPALFAATNLAAGRVRLPAMLIGTPMAIDRAERRHVWPLQRARPDGCVGWRYLHAPAEELGPTYQALRSAGLSKVWVTPKVPFMVPLGLGLVISWLWGNLVIRLLGPYLA